MGDGWPLPGGDGCSAHTCLRACWHPLLEIGISMLLHSSWNFDFLCLFAYFYLWRAWVIPFSLNFSVYSWCYLITIAICFSFYLCFCITFSLSELLWLSVSFSKFQPRIPVIHMYLFFFLMLPLCVCVCVFYSVLVSWSLCLLPTHVCRSLLLLSLCVCLDSVRRQSYTHSLPLIIIQPIAYARCIAFVDF